MSPTPAPPIQDGFHDCLEAQRERWRHCEKLPECTLLRLAILRDLMRALHAQKSHCLATGRRDLSQALGGHEERLHCLREQAQLHGDLLDLFERAAPGARKRTRVLPEALHHCIARDKFERYDRKWEAALAGEAVSVGWRFWRLDAWVSISLAEEWNQRLVDQLWPSGVVLFVESAQSPSPSAGQGAQGAMNVTWHGSWIAVAHPRFKIPDEITPGMQRWPGTAEDAASPPKWRLLYSPKGARE